MGLDVGRPCLRPWDSTKMNFLAIKRLSAELVPHHPSVLSVLSAYGGCMVSHTPQSAVTSGAHSHLPSAPTVGMTAHRPSPIPLAPSYCTREPVPLQHGQGLSAGPGL